MVNLCVCVPGAVGNGWGLGEVRVWGGNLNVFVLRYKEMGPDA